MANVSSRIIRFACTPDALLEVITLPEFHEANLTNQGNPKVKVTETSRTDDELRFEAEVEEYAKGVRGINKKKTETTWTYFTWNLKQRTAEWTYKGAHARAKVWGDIRIDPDGDGCRLTENFRVDIKIPLVGRGIEKIVIRETEAFWPKYEELINQFIAKRDEQ